MKVEELRKALAEKNPVQTYLVTPHSQATPVRLNLTHQIELRVCQHCPKCGFDLDIPSGDLIVKGGFSYIPGPKKQKAVKEKKAPFVSKAEEDTVEL